MSALSIQPTYPIFTETDGQPLEDGYIWIGTANLDPQGNPINVYWDAALTQLAGQPIRTEGGYPVNSGTPARLYVNSDYSIRVMNKNGSVVYSAPAATERYGNIITLADLDFIQTGTGAIVRTALSKMRDLFSPFDFGATGSGDDSTAIRNALNAAKVIDGLGKTYTIFSSITIPQNVTLQNIKLIAGVPGINMVLVNTGSKLLNATLVGTGTTSIVERGVYPAADSVTDVIIENIDVSNITFGVHGQYVSNSATRPERWRVTGYIHDIVGTVGSSEGYGVLFSPANHCTINVKFKNIQRHAVYLSSSASYNEMDIDVDGCNNFAVQIFSGPSQNESAHNRIRGRFKNLTQNAVNQGGAVGLIAQANYTDVSIQMRGEGNTSNGIWVEGSGGAGGVYPTNNNIHDCEFTGSYINNVIACLYSEASVVQNNVIRATWGSAAIAMGGNATIPVTSGGSVQGNTINGLGTSFRGITNSYEVPIYIGENGIIGVTNNKVIDFSTAQKRSGFNRSFRGRARITSIGAGTSKDLTVTFGESLENVVVSTTVEGGTVSSFNVVLTAMAFGVTPSGDTNFVARAYNGAAASQDIDFFWSVFGD